MTRMLVLTSQQPQQPQNENKKVKKLQKWKQMRKQLDIVFMFLLIYFLFEKVCVCSPTSTKHERLSAARRAKQMR